MLSTLPEEKRKCQFFGLHGDPAGTTLQQGSGIDDIGDIAALDEEIEQSDRYLETSHVNAAD